jgi:hypothetical protein
MNCHSIAAEILQIKARGFDSEPVSLAVPDLRFAPLYSISCELSPDAPGIKVPPHQVYLPLRIDVRVLPARTRSPSQLAVELAQAHGRGENKTLLQESQSVR